MRQLPELANVHQVTPRPGSELVIRLKPDEAARLGVTSEAVASIARVATLGEAMARINALPIMKKLPSGVTQPPYGQAADMAELFGSFGGAMLAGVGMILGVLVLLFRNFFKPITILAALPLSLAMAAGMLPTARGIGEGAAMRAPMAIALSSRPAMPGRQALVSINVARS